MCLNTKLTKPLIAKRNIKVYKILKIVEKPVEGGQTTITTDEKGISTRTTISRFTTYINSLGWNCVWEIGKTNSVDKMSYRERPARGLLMIEQGLHAYSTLKTAISVRGSISNRLVAECIIPKGTKYYTGAHNGTHKGTTSEALKFVRIVPNEEQTK